jgi:GNAT superfamily N-acetyltransferase
MTNPRTMQAEHDDARAVATSTAADLAAADAAAEATRRFGMAVAARLPGFVADVLPHGTVRGASGSLMATDNGVFNLTREPDLGEMIEAMAAMADCELPWSVLCRGEPAAELVDAAAHLGRTVLHSSPLMVIDSAAFTPATSVGQRAWVRAADRADFDVYMRVLEQTFGLRRELMGLYGTADGFELPGAVNYLIEVDGTAVATGRGAVCAGQVGVTNIGTLPGWRGKGYGRAMTEAVLSDGFAAGATGGYLLASPDGLPLYTSMGFRVVEHWTFLLPGDAADAA